MIHSRSKWVEWVYKAIKLARMAHSGMNGYKMQTTYLLVVFAIVVQHTFADEFPTFIQKCKVSDPKFDDCVLSSANNYISSILKGNDKYGLAPAVVEPSSNTIETYNVTDYFSIQFINMSSDSFQNFLVKSIHFDFQKKMLTFWAQVAPYHFTGNYVAAGDILGKPIHESGKLNMTFENMEFVSMVTLDFKMINEKKYLEAISCIMTVTPKNLQFKPYDQLVVGEPMTVEQKLEFQSYIDQIPSIYKKEIETYDKYIVDALNAIFKRLPFEEIFLP